jgi:hypothetical protein
MSALSIRLSDSLHAAARQLAATEGVSVNHLITLALAEKISALNTEDYLGARAANASREKYLAAVANLPKGQTLPGDEI